MSCYWLLTRRYIYRLTCAIYKPQSENRQVIRFFVGFGQLTNLQANWPMVKRTEWNNPILGQLTKLKPSWCGIGWGFFKIYSRKALWPSSSYCRTRRQLISTKSDFTKTLLSWVKTIQAQELGRFFIEVGLLLIMYSFLTSVQLASLHSTNLQNTYQMFGVLK